MQQGPIHLLVKVEIKTIERSIRVAEARLFMAPVKEPVLAPLQFITDERGDEIERGEALGLSLVQARFKDGRHAGEAEFAEGGIDFDEIHEQSPVLRSIRSR